MNATYSCEYRSVIKFITRNIWAESSKGTGSGLVGSSDREYPSLVVFLQFTAFHSFISSPEKQVIDPLQRERSFSSLIEVILGRRSYLSVNRATTTLVSRDRFNRHVLGKGEESPSKS